MWVSPQMIHIEIGRKKETFFLVVGKIFDAYKFFHRNLDINFFALFGDVNIILEE